MKRAEYAKSIIRNKAKGISYIEERKDKSRQWRLKNPDRVKRNSKAYNSQNADKSREYFKTWRVENKDKLHANYVKWIDKNREKHNLRTRELRKDPARRAKLSEYSRKRTESDHVYRLSRLLRCRIKSALKSQSAKKNKKTFELLGMSGANFMEYMLSHPQNKSGMFTAENYGVAWVVDHIRPIASFDLRSDKGLREAFHYSNCQPLTPDENTRKGCWWNGFWWKEGKPYDMPLCSNGKVRAS